MKSFLLATALVALVAISGSAQSSLQHYRWTEATHQAAFPGNYNFPLFTLHNKLWAFHGEGNWVSDDGVKWAPAALPHLDFNTGYQQYVLFNDAVYALGTIRGNYLDMHLGSRIARTNPDFTNWEIVAETSELPARVFYGATVFDDKIWMFGGFDGKTYYNDVWNSSDGEHWQKVSGHNPWDARSNPSVLVFHHEMWLLGGGVIDGNIYNDVWHSADGIHWTLAAEKMTSIPIFGYSPIVFDGSIWLIGANRNGTFRSALVVSSDGTHWDEQDAPWTPRGGVATAVFNGNVVMTGGKYSVTESGRIRFIYNNDVWLLSREPLWR